MTLITVSKTVIEEVDSLHKQQKDRNYKNQVEVQKTKSTQKQWLLFITQTGKHKEKKEKKTIQELYTLLNTMKYEQLATLNQKK